MEIIQKSIYSIDYENHLSIKRDAPIAFEEYVMGLISYISENASIREYKTRSNATEVIGSIIAVCNNLDNENIVSERMDIMANRLVRKEAEAQEAIGRTSTNVQKGSLIQALLKNDEDIYTYLLAKVEHSEWVDDADFSFKTGFSKDKKTIWKSCLIELPDLMANEFYAKIYSNTVAKYWSNDFLELDELNSDEVNTSKAFKAIDSTLNQNFKGIISPDHTIIRNAFVSYLINNDHIDYETMIDSVLGNYNPIDDNISIEKINSIKEKLIALPDKKSFDRQFNAINSSISARIKKVYPINEGIDLKVNREISDLPNIIHACEENGVKYIKIRTNNENTFKKFNLTTNN